MLLAVSGGPDSTALMGAAARAGSAAPLHVATIDHGLRPNSAAEAAAVAMAARTLGLPHRTLVWTGPKPASGVQAAARAARYELLAAHAGSLGAGLVLTGHTRDDQAETVLMRLLAGSGPAGLAGMRPTRDLTSSIRLGRPFLGLAKADLVDYCAARGLAFIRDPSNGDDRYARARLRRLRPDLDREGLSTDRLCRLAERCGRDDAALAAWAGTVFAAATTSQAGGTIRLDGTALRAVPAAVLLRVASLAVTRLNATWDHSVGRERLERLERLVLDGLVPALRSGTPLRRTLRETLFEVTRTGDLVLRPAPTRRTHGTASQH
ncbi:tRNA lysidine(34) synthetase TilS [Methylobacterium sp. 37f]|uniref:tRNA lysidine(34) synthetase TilS n=1 Tax=Methylobacterium sp. 37f TaxID=2817058 RepID=UPI001FFCE0ED|nr:tRNA lysidine(34) synthetase TilS [Methylobacterium sp. 37f]